MCLQTTNEEDEEKHIKHHGFYFRELLNVRFFFFVMQQTWKALC